MKRTVILVFGLGLLLGSCKKPITEPNSGIYRGTFVKVFDNGDTNAQGIAHLSLTEGNSAFQMSGDTVSVAPYSCYGTYIINNSTQMTFDGQTSQEIGYDKHYVLDTVYNYVFDDHSFNLRLRIDTTLYEYKLVRI